MPDLSTGFDRADGEGGRLGTSTPVDSVLADIPGGTTTTVDNIPVEELPDSPSMERAEQATFTHKFRMSLSEAMQRLQFLGRGTIREDSFGNVFKILSCTVNPEKGGVAVLTIVEEAV